MHRRMLLPAALAAASVLALAACSGTPSTDASSAGWGGSDDIGLAPLSIPAFGSDIPAHVVLTNGQLTNVQGVLAEASSFTITAACSGAAGTSAMYYLLTGDADTNPTSTVASPALTVTIDCDGKAHETASKQPLQGPIKIDLRQLNGGRVNEFYAELAPKA